MSCLHVGTESRGGNGRQKGEREKMTYDLPDSHVPPTSPETSAISELTEKITTKGKRGEDGKELTRPHIPNVPNPPHDTAKHARLSIFSLALGPPIMSRHSLYKVSHISYNTPASRTILQGLSSWPIHTSLSSRVESSRIQPCFWVFSKRSRQILYIQKVASKPKPNPAIYCIRQLVRLSADTTSGVPGSR